MTIRNKELSCGHRKHVKPRPARGWKPWCIECLRRWKPFRIYPIREQLAGETIAALTDEKK